MEKKIKRIMLGAPVKVGGGQRWEHVFLGLERGGWVNKRKRRETGIEKGNAVRPKGVSQSVRSQMEKKK